MAMYQDDGNGSYPRDFLWLVKWIVILTAVGVFIGMLFPYCSRAADPWTKTDTALEVTWQVLHAIDLGQTLTIADRPDKYYELNPLLGKHPDRGKVYAYFLTGSVLHLGVTHVLPRKWRTPWQGVTLTVTGACVANNFNVGIGLHY